MARNNATGVDLDLLDWEDFQRDDIAVTIYLAILCVLGTIGNIHVIILYVKRYNGSNHHVFILNLAAVDLLACSVCLPFEIADIYKSYTFTNSAVCKIFRFLIHFSSLSSGFMLVLIAVERYRKLCTPFGRQLVGKEIRLACAVVIGASVAISVPSFILYGSAKKQIPGNDVITGNDCTTLQDEFKHTFVYLIIMLLISTLMFIACVIMYSIVGKVLFKHYSKRSKQTTPTAVHSSHENSSVTGLDVDSEHKKNNTLTSDDKHATLQSQKSLLMKLKQTVSFKSTDSLPKMGSMSDKNANKAKLKQDRTMQITLMLLVATAVSYLGYIPPIVLGLLKAANLVVSEGGPFISVLTRGFYLNHVVNPVVYFLMDKKLRKDALKLYKKCCKKITGCRFKSK